MEKLDILFSKVFCRLRHKTQLFSGEIDDHFHTRLQHTLEVEEIAINIAKRLENLDGKAGHINYSLLSQMALLHDIGHTPFGHAGERALHEILSGKEKNYNLPDFKKYDLNIGFKHNINSGLLYLEMKSKERKSLRLLDGIVKHTKIFYKNEKDLDYGFDYVFQRFKRTTFNDEHLSIEGYIVSIADEIAQVSSDYLDICLNSEINKQGINFDCKPFSYFKGIDLNRENVSFVTNMLIKRFVNSFKKYPNYKENNQERLKMILNDFDKTRNEYILKNEKIATFDKRSDVIIKTIFSKFYNDPSNMNADFFKDFVYRIRRHKYETSYVFSEVFKPISIKDNCIEFIRVVEEIVFSDKVDISKKRMKDYKTIYKMYLRSIAIYIAKMTDNYANHKYEVLCKSKVDIF